ncbi:protein disulfide oxidoreductase [Ursidibacter maritimus]|uniref:Protein disulfide oxidoreductase n=1 Tax=Ursidibacter maritimus TaxID=1331689 RepID=A0A949WJ11_9PAST|nr:protein disulfide oxidoreductase [Ursidibacter maritimus]KAE9540155.1 thioredoxin [Ursidibacter maritimus]MBV6523797.1 protein disulfide oxidoreductase [Ursidibacter maritimus]MBV6526307.1 protein disulfide oxidoreductase [Ursidibacter maritimus]MBV6527847.1 protein disulfide oxidoreductase [Ursidibacter maritimus]MBV6529200.1 protein disulfide oxidoreductase [Ursidibacter maritimus]
MPKKSTLISRLLKNILLFGSLFIILSIVMDWYRKPTAPAQFAEQVLYDIEQQPKVIAQLSHNKPMLLYFWGSWCQFCDYTSPAIQQLAEQGTDVLGVALKSGSDSEVKQYLAKENYRFATLNDPSGKFSKSWDIQATPTILIIKDGKIINHTTGLTSYWGLKVRLWLAEFTQ